MKTSVFPSRRHDEKTLPTKRPDETISNDGEERRRQHDLVTSDDDAAAPQG